jgi:hypothetical protein
MSFVMAGIKEMFVAAAGTFPTANLTNAMGLGVRQPGTFAVTFINEMRDMRGRAFPNMLNFRAEANSMQLNDLANLKNLVTWAKAGGVSAAVITSGIVKGGTAPYYVDSETGGLYKFEGSGATSTCLGLDFEIALTMKERLLKVILERAFKYDGSGSPAAGTGNKVLYDAATAQVPFVASRIPDLDTTKVIQGFLTLPFYSTLDASVLQPAFADIYLDDFTCSVKTKSSKNGFNSSLVSGFSVTIEGSCSGPDISVVKEIMKYSAPADITVYLDAPTNTKSLIFKSGGLTRLGSVEIGDEKRTAKLMFTGEYDADYVAQNTNDITFNTYLT